MNEDSLAADIDAMIASLGTPAENPQGPAPAVVRFIVATTWSDAAVPLTLLRAFVSIVPPDAAAQLIFAVPHEPTEVDARCVHVLLEGVGSGSLPTNLEIASFEEVSHLPYDCAVVPAGDTGATIQQVGGVITRMHDVVRRGESGASDSLNEGDATALRERLAAFVG